MNTIKLQDSIVFTEEEYKSLFSGGRNKTSLADLKTLLIEKGVENITSKTLYRDIENFIFNSIPRETAPKRLLDIYKNLVQLLSYVELIGYVSERRYNSKITKKIYAPLVTGVIKYVPSETPLHIIDIPLSNLVGSSVLSENIQRGKLLASKLSDVKYNGTLCSCSSDYLTDIEYNNGIKCGCCTHKINSFANDCVIKLGRSLLKRKVYNFLLFTREFRDEIISDVLNIIGLIVII